MASASPVPPPAHSTASVWRPFQVSLLLVAFLLPFLSWGQVAGAVVLALLLGAAVLTPFEPRVLSRGSRVVEIHYLLSILALVLIFRHHPAVVAGAWAITALGIGLAGVAGPALRGPALSYQPGKTYAGLSAFWLFGTLGAYVLMRWVDPSIAPEKALIVAALTALVGAIVESLPLRLDENFTVPLVSGAFLFCTLLVEASALDSNLPYLGRRILIALAVNLVFAFTALALKSIDRAGTMVGFLVGVTVYIGWGWKSFLVLVTFVFLGSLATRLGYERKSARGVAQGNRGRRTWREVLANGAPGAFFAVLVITTHHEAAFLLAMVAAFAEAAGDTVSSEIGQWLATRARLITTLRPVAAGENGGISLTGTLAGTGASALVVAVSYALGLSRNGLPGAALALGAAIIGNLVDSVLGATAERRGLVSNDVVNFAGSAFAGALALSFSIR